MPTYKYVGSFTPDELRGKNPSTRPVPEQEQVVTQDGKTFKFTGSYLPEELKARMGIARKIAQDEFVAKHESRGSIEDTIAGLTSGAVQLAEYGARIARMGESEEKAPNLTKFIEGVKEFREKTPFLQPSREALTKESRRMWYEGVSSFVPSVGLGLPGAIAGSFGGTVGTVAGYAASGGTLFGMAEYDQFWEDARKAVKEGKMDPALLSEVNKKALMSAFAEGGLEAVSDAIDMLSFKVGRTATAPLKATVRNMLKKGGKEVGKDIAKGYAVSLPSEVATEMAQNYTETKLRQDLGIAETTPWKAAKESAGPAAVMTLLFGVGASGLNARERHYAIKALEDPEANPNDRMMASKAIASELRKYDQKHGTDYAKQWVGDSLTSIIGKKPIDIDSKIIEKYAQKPVEGQEPPIEEPPAATPPGPKTPPPAPPAGPGEITGVPRTPMLEDEEPIIPEEEMDADDLAEDLSDEDLDKLIELDDAANEANTEPTEAQVEAGNYKKGHINLHGMNISIENPRGSTRKGKDADGKEWESTMTHHYGYIKGTTGTDKDHLDTFIGPNPQSDRVFIVNQGNPKTGKFDEHKIMLGFDNIEEARKGYLSNYEEGWKGLRSIYELDIEDFKKWAFDESGWLKEEYDPEDYPEFHEETIGKEEAEDAAPLIGETPPTSPETTPTPPSGTPAIQGGARVPVTEGTPPQGGEDEVELSDDVMSGLEEIFGGTNAPHGEEKTGEEKEHETTGEEAKEGKPEGESRPEGEEKGKEQEEVTGGARAPEGEKTPEPEPKPEREDEVEGGARETEGEAKPEEKPEEKPKVESKQSKAIKAFNAVADQVKEKVSDKAYAIIDLEGSGRYGTLVSDIKNILADMTRDVNTLKGSPDEVQRSVSNALEILGDVDKWVEEIPDNAKELGQTLAEAFNGILVYNKAQWLAREIGDAVGDGRFKDATKYLNEIKYHLDKGRADYSKWVSRFKSDADNNPVQYTSLQEKGKLKWGKTIGGSRADIAQPLGGKEADIEGLDDSAKEKKVNKDFVWPTPNYDIMINEGTDAHVALMVKKIRDAIPQKPKVYDNGRQRPLRGEEFKQFIRKVSEIRDILMAVKTEDDMKDASERVRKFIREGDHTSWDLYYDADDSWKRISMLLSRAFAKMYNKELRYIEENAWPGGGAWRRGILIMLDDVDGEDVWCIKRKKKAGILEYWSMLATGFETKEKAEEYLVTVLKPRIEKELKDKRMDRPQLKTVIRKGPDYRGGKNIEPETFLKAFGFTKGWGEEGAGMETGKWNKSTLQMYINCAYDSFMDLARMLNVDPKVMSLNGTLSIAFGARGRGGKALAHYEPGKKVINLTKMNGAGSLAHEWGHALDHYLGRLFDLGPATSKATRGYMTEIVTNTYLYGHARGNDALKDVFNKFWKESVINRYSTAEELDALKENAIQANRKWVDHLVDRLEKMKLAREQINKFRDLAEEILGVKPDVASKRVGELETMYKNISGNMMEMDAIVSMKDNFKYAAVKEREADDTRTGNGKSGSLKMTNWMSDLDTLDPKATYWKTPAEIFARAFESYVEDTIIGYASQSDYLVHGTQNDHYYNNIYPSPENGERALINSKLENVIRAIGFPEFNVEDKPIITTEWDNPMYDQEEEDKDTETESRPETQEGESPEITIEDYSEKSFVVRDRTGKHADRIIALGGKLNPGLKGGEGYIFPLWKKDKVVAELADLLYGGEKGKPNYPYKNLTIEDLSKPASFGLIMKNMLVMLKSGWHIGKNATAIRAEVARMLNGDVREVAAGWGNTKAIDELMEYAIVTRAKEIIQSAEASNMTEDELYAQLKDLYDTQPILGSRTSSSAENQAYSTPVHIAWIMQAAAGVREGVSVYEPTAGTGMLLTKADESKVMANEIDETRLGILRDQGFANVTNNDGIKAVSLAGVNRTFDVVLANPPFGKAPAPKTLDGYQISMKDHLIIADALKAMKKDGVAALIIGGHNYDGDKMKSSDRLFFNWLYSHYNVTSNVEMPGMVYSKQGATFPFRILFINGVNKTGKGVAPTKKDIIALDNADQLFALYQKGELYGARRISTEGTEGVQQGPEVVGGARGSSGGGQGGSTSVRTSVSGQDDDAGGQGPGVGGRSAGSSGGSTGGVLGPRGGRRGPGGEDAGLPGDSEGGDGHGELSPGRDQSGETEGEVGAESGTGRGPRGKGAVRSGQKSDVEGIPGLSLIEQEVTSMSDEDIDKLFDETIEAKELLKKAGTEVAEGLHEAIKGLSTLFTPKDTLGIGVVFDEESYQKALPHLQKTWEAFKAAGKTLKDLAVFLKNKYGDTIVPFAKRFIKEIRDVTTNLHQVPYQAMSKAKSIEDTFIPKNMALPLRRALERIEDKVGDIDEYVAAMLQYKDKETLWKHLGPDQIDAVAIALYNISRGKTAIIGDQTGVGKGRIAASMIRYAHLQGKRAIFFTEKANLFSDIYRDIVDIGWGDNFKPFILASDHKLAAIYDKDGKRVFKLLDDSKRRDIIRKFAGIKVDHDPTVLDPFNTIVTNYSQINQANEQQQFLTAAVPGSVLILDEAHNASGIDSTTGLFMQSLIENLGPQGDLMFLSATFAKRPNTMGIYINRTAQAAANMEPNEILEAIIRGKTPMQEYVCAALTRVGQYVRREKSFKGITMNAYIDAKNREIHEKQADAITKNLRGIIDVDKELRAWVNQIIHQAAEGDLGASFDIAGIPWIPGGEIVNGKRTFSNTVTKSNFASTVHNAVRQSLLCMKCDLAVEQAIKELKGDNAIVNEKGEVIREGRRQKPVIAVSSTLGSFLADMHKEGLVQLGQEADMRLKDVIRVYLKQCLKITIKDERGVKREYFMDPNQLPNNLKNRYFEIENAIMKTTPDLPGSPIDYMLYRLRSEGFNVDEITGRTHCIEYDLKTGKGTFKNREDKRVAAIRAFNNKPGDKEIKQPLDALIINAAGSVGLSIHAAPDTDRVPRIYLGVQAELNIDTEVQKMGRINRKGQVVLPEFKTLFLDIPAEIRPATVLARKMRSMSANTSANADSPLQNKDVPDMLNEYGDKVAAEWMMDHPDVLYKTFADKDPESISIEDLNYEKVSGKIAIQPVEVQREFFEEAEESYNIMKEDMQKRGEWDLDIETLDYKADTVSQDIMVEGSDETNPFGGSTYIEEVTVENKAKPYRSAQIEKMVQEELAGKTPEEYNQSILDELKKRYDAYREQVLAKWEETKRLKKEKEEAEAKAAEKEGSPLTPKRHEGEEKSPAIIKKMEEQWNKIYRALASTYDKVEVGNLYTIEQNIKLRAVLLKIELLGKIGNPLNLNKIKLTFACNGMYQELGIMLGDISFSGQEEEKYYVREFYSSMDEWDAHLEPLMRENRFMVTGNLLQGFVNLEEGSRSAKLIRYTTIDNEIKEGIILPRGFVSPAESPNSLVRISPENAVTFMNAKGVHRDDQVLYDNNASVRVYLDTIRVPKSRKMGYKFWGDRELQSLMRQGIFEKSGEDYVGRYLPENRERIIKVLTSLGCRFSVRRGAYNIVFGGSQDQEDIARFSLGSKRPLLNQMKVSEINKAIEPIMKELKNSPRVVVVESADKLPNPLYQWALETPDGARARGCYYNDTVYLIADALKGASEAQEVILHEIIGHYGILGSLGELVHPFMRAVYDQMSEDQKREINEVYRFDLRTADGRYRLASEYVASQAEKGKLEASLWQKLLMYIREWLKSMGFTIRPNNDHLQALVAEGLKMSRQYVRRGEQGATSNEAMFSRQAKAEALEINTNSLYKEVNDRLKASKGIGGLVRTREKMKAKVTEMWHSLRRHFPHLDPDLQGDLINTLRIYEAIPEYSKYRAKGMIEDILGGLNDVEYDVFSYNIILADLMKDLDDPIIGPSMLEKDELPFGYKNKEQVQKDLKHFRDEAAKSPQIMEALRKREEIMTNLRHDLVRYGLLDKSVLNDPNYYHHQVMEYWGMKRQFPGAGVSSKDVRPHKKGWQIGREGSIKDYNTEYIESEFEVFAQGIAQVETKKTMDRLDRAANIIKSLRAQAKMKNYTNCIRKFKQLGLIKMIEGKDGELKEITPFTPIEQQIAIGFSKLGKMAYEGELEGPQEYQGVIEWLAKDYIDRKNARKMGDLAGGERYQIDDPGSHPKVFSFLAYLAKRQDPGSGPAARVFKGIKEKENLMKDYLGNEYRTFRNEIPDGYTIWRPEPNTAWYLTNSIADKVLEQVLKGERVLKEEDVRQVLARGVDVMWVIPDGLAATLNNFRDYKDEGPIGRASEKMVSMWKQWVLINPFKVIKYNLNNLSGDFDIIWAYDPQIIKQYAWGAAQDLWKEARHKELSPGLKAELDEAHRFGVLGTGMTVQDIPDITNQMTIDGYLEILSGRKVSWISKRWNDLKKYTTWRENVLRLAAYRYFLDRVNRGDEVFGASNIDQVRKIKDRKERAAHLARELVGDYGNLTVAGQWMRRKLIPFYSWIEINAPRYVRLFHNLPVEGEARGRAVAAFSAGMVKKAALLSAKMLTLYGLVILWNATFFPDEEEELGEMQRRQLHLILGRRKDGTIITIRFQGALSDALSWFGLENPAKEISDIVSGRKTWGEQGIEAIKAAPNRFVNSAQPFMKLGAEELMGKSFFPDAFNPRPIKDRIEHAARMFSLDSPYRHIAGKPTRNQWKDLDFWQDFLNLWGYEQDPKEAAYFDTRDRAMKYLSRKGLNPGYFQASSSGKSGALYNYKRAMQYGDVEAAKEYYDKYIELGGTETGLSTSIRLAHPTASIPKKYKQDFIESLSEKDRARMEVAIEWYQKVYMGGE